MTTHACDLVLRGGRVLDPETGRDEVADVAVLDGTVVAVVAAGDCSEVHLVAHEEVDVSGAVVAPGWIDLHSHAQSVAGSRLQAHDGVTTALDLEAGTVEVERWYADVAAAGRAIGYGTSASWQISRMIHVGGIEVGGPEQALAFFGDQRWQAEARPEQTAALLARVEAELAQGALGVGMLQGYGPRIDPEEYLAVSRVAASAGVATFTHARDLVEQLPGVPVDGAEEIVRAAGETGVRAHYCHVNSSSSRLVDRVHRLIEASAAPVTTEAYPYGAGATPISADFLSPDRLARRGLTPSSLVYAPTGRRVADVAELLRLRAQDPGGIAIVHLLDEEVAADREVLDRCLTFPGTVVASDAMPLAWAAERSDPYAWPPPGGTPLHPRTAGTYSRFWRRYVRELGVVSPLEAVRRCSLGPARVLEPSAPAMRRKGRLQVGADADLVVLDLDRVTDRSTYADGTRTSTGYRLVVVDGTVVVRDDMLVLDALPGQAVRAG